jgi:hypothetical protein
MSNFEPRTSRWRARLAAGLAGAAALAAAGPAAADAGGTFACSASALRGSVLGTRALEPVTANAGQATCRDDQATMADALPAPLHGGFIAAGTTLSRAGDRPDQVKAVAAGGVTDLAIRALPELPIALPTATIPDAVRQLSLPVPASLQLLGVPAQLTFDMMPAITGLLPQSVLPAVDLASVQAAVAYAGAQCRDGVAVPVGSSQVSGLRVLGQELPLGAVVDRTVRLIDTRSIELSKLDIDSVPLPDALKLLPQALVRQVLDTVLKPAVAALPPVSIPPTLAQVTVTPGEQTVSSGVLVQRALRVHVSILGREIADLVVGEATAGANGVDCSPAPEPEPATLACTKRKLALIDVVPAGRRVRLFGIADEEYAGRTVDILFRGTGRRVAEAVVEDDGSFSTTAPMPPRAVRSTNRARYVATIDRHKSLDLKLMRRMVVESMSARNGAVTIVGRVVKPLADPVAPIEVRQRVTCSKEKVVGRAKPGPDGRFRVTVPAPDGQSEGVYRLATEVRKTARNPKRYPTFTLPRAVNLS